LNKVALEKRICEGQVWVILGEKRREAKAEDWERTDPIREGGDLKARDEGTKGICKACLRGWGGNS
jgi:hypothetical protein